VLLQRQHVRIQAAEDEAAVALHAGNTGQAVVLLVEAVRVAGALLLEDHHRVTAGVEHPAVEGATEIGAVAAHLAHQRGAAVAAGVDEGIDLAFRAAHQDDRLAAHEQAHVVVGIRNLALVGEVNPVAFPDALHLELEDFRVGEDGAVDPHHPVASPVVDVAGQIQVARAAACVH
jgi:hypothetical protein